MNKSTKTCVSIKKQEIPSAKNVTLQSNKTPSSRVLMDWINGELDVNMKTMKQLNNGAIYCQLIHKIFPQALPVRKVNFQAHGSLDIEANFRLLQSAFTRLGINHAISPLELTRGLGHFKFVTWFQKFYAANKKPEAKAFPEAHKLKRSRTSTLLQPEQRTRGVHVAPRSQSVVGKPVIRRLDPPEVASASASPPVTASAALQKLRAQPFVSMIPKLKTYSLGNIHRATAEPLQNASRLDSSNARRWLQEDEARATAAEEMVQPELPAVETAIESILYQEEIPIFIPPLNLESPDEETDVEEAENVEAVKEATKAASPREDTPKTGDPKDVFEVPTEKAAKDASPREVAKEAAPRQATRIDTPRVTAKKITRRKTAKETTRRKGAKDATLCEVAKDAAPRQAAKEATRKETTKESSEKAVPKEDAPEESAAKPKQYKTTSNIAVAVHPGDGRKQDEAITRALSELTDESAAAFASDADSDCDSITILLSENRMLEKIVDRVRSIATDIRLDCNKALRKIRKLLMLHYVEKYEMVNNQ